MPDMTNENESVAKADTPFTEVPIEIKVSVGHARPKIRELLELTHESILALDRRLEDPVELFVGDKLIAKGELQELEGEEAGKLAVRLTEIVNSRPGE